MKASNWQKELDYTDDLVCLFQPTEDAQRALERFTRAVAPIGMRLAFSKCKGADT